jgi:hypothetical protein
MAETLVASNLFQSVTGGSETALPNQFNLLEIIHNKKGL